MAEEEEVNYVVGQDNVKKFGLDLHNPVFFVTSIGAILIVLIAAIWTSEVGMFLNGEGAEDWPGLRSWLESTFDWLLLGAANIFVLFALALMVSPLGKIRLGGVDAEPDFSYPGWFAMLFAAGMGIGLMFFGVLEPFWYYTGSWAQPLNNSAGNTNLSMAATMFHWGLHPWAIYSVVALALAFFAFNKGYPLALRSAFFPLIGNKVWGWPGDIVDILAVFATLFGLVTSLGLGASQAAQGLNIVASYPTDNFWLSVLIVIITAAAFVSVWRGVKGGVKRLSELNLILMAVMGVYVIIAGGNIPWVIQNFFVTLWDYVTYIVPLSIPFGRETAEGMNAGDAEFLSLWTTFYWAWWIAWSPFVGMFIARVSRGRTVREFIFYVIIVPTLASCLWFVAMGGQAMLMAGNEDHALYGVIADYQETQSLFEYLKLFAGTTFLQWIAVVLVIVFFVTSSDSGSLVIDTITAGGKTDANKVQRMFWVCFEGLLAIVLLIAGGTSALQAGAIALGTPFAVLLLLMCVGLLRGMLREDPNKPASAAGQVTID